jgi:hypothetical protein
MEEKKRSKILEILNSKLLILVLIFGLFFITTIFAGDMIFENGNLNVSSVLHVDDTNGRVGIGTSTPTYTLDVSGNGRVNGNFICEGLISSNFHTTGSALVDGGALIEGAPGEQLEISSNGWSGDHWSIYHNALDASDDYGLVFKRGSDASITLGKDGEFTTNRATVIKGTKTQSSSTDALDVTGVTGIGINTNAGNVVIGGFANGVPGQIVYLYKLYTANSFTIEHLEATGTQQIATPEAVDMTFNNYGGVTLICVGATWRVVNF